MNNILKTLSILLIALTFFANADAKLNLFAQPRYIPELSYYSDSGKKHKLTEYKSDLLLAVLWSRFCGPCIGDMKHLQKFADKTKNKGIKVIIISPDEEWKSIDERRNFLKKIGAPNLESYTDRKSNFAHGMGIMVTPVAVMVNRNGEEIGQISGSVEWDDDEVVDYMIKLKNTQYQTIPNKSK
ncbi:MAG: TlpA family protein disulfide reductase [Alphaproteobacteria bacterium]|jgi:thiol-disulfide isomerase/thioredoxin|nr:TlpA family protein disulfide reductase [Alphaproteobacteria bacterium]MBR3662454.1 TlpA family protein disulfide reductase [Alphaproteobacteria bacterium]